MTLRTSASKAPEVFDPARAHRRRPTHTQPIQEIRPAQHQGSLLVDQDGLALARRRQAEPAPAQYNDRSDEQRDPFVVVQRSRTDRFRSPRGVCAYPVRLSLLPSGRYSRYVFFWIQLYRLLEKQRRGRGSSSSPSSP